MQHRWGRNRVFRGLLRVVLQEREVLDHDRPGIADLAGDDRDRRLLLGAAELGAGIDARADALDLRQEIEVPPVAAEFAVGDALEADLFLLPDRFEDRLVLPGAILPGLRERGRTKEAADLVGAERGLHR